MTRRLTLAGRTFEVAGDPDDLYYLALEDGVVFEDDVLALLKKVVPRDAIIADVGANIGVNTMALAHLAPDGHVHSFEPDPTARTFLEENIEANSINNVSVHPVALGEAAGSATMYHNREFLAGSMVVDQADETFRDYLTTARTPGAERLRGEFIDVDCTTLDAVVDKLALDRLDVLKIDTEGYDIDVLRGARRTIESLKPVVVVEFASLALTAHRRMLPGDALREIRESFDHVFLIQVGGRLWEITSDDDAFVFLHQNATMRPVQDLVCVSDGSRLMDEVVATAGALVEGSPQAEHLALLEAELGDVRAALAGADDMLVEVRNKLDDVTKERDWEHARANDLQRELNAIRETLSWRITRPLRAMKGITRRGDEDGRSRR
jgi:FkbM family methyltransferase